MSDRKLSAIEPERVFFYFEEISKIPRGSYNEKAVSDYCVQLVNEWNEDRASKNQSLLQVYQDELFNVVIIKEASDGYEDVEPVIIQGHLDMVCEKTADSDHDFLKDGLDLYVDGDFLKAKNTTLGGDDGIAVAMALALLDDKTTYKDKSPLKHPRLEVVLTVSEETGMEGAIGIDLSMLKGKRLLNIDSEEEGIFTAGCAGGSTAVINIPIGLLSCEMDDIETDNIEIDNTKSVNYRVCEIKVSGPKGGHSGVDINKGRLNANKLLMDYLLDLRANDVRFMVSSISGGTRDNVIASSASAVILVDEASVSSINSKEIDITTDKAKIEIEFKENNMSTAFDSFIIEKLVSELPSGVIKMSEDIDGLVETSINFAKIVTNEKSVTLTYSIRSSVKSEKERIIDMIRDKASEVSDIVDNSIKISVTIKGDYPAWEFKKDSKLRDDMVSIYTSMYNKQPVIDVIHAGLECGILSEKIDGLDAVSFGPDILDIHSVNERLSISSVESVWEFVLNVLKLK